MRIDAVGRDKIFSLALAARHAHEARHPLDAVTNEVFTAKLNRVLDNTDMLGHSLSGPGSGLIAFVFGTLVNAPPVYNPGGQVCFAEFSVFPPTGQIEELLTSFATQARERGAVLLIIACSAGDTNKETQLAEAGFTIASEWYRSKLPLPETASQDPGNVRLAIAGDVPAILVIADRKRDEYETYQPIFWKKADTLPQQFAPFLTSKVENSNGVVLVHEDTAGKIDGYVFVEPNGYIDDYAVAHPNLWSTVGKVLLIEANHRSKEKGIPGFLVVCGNGDLPKRSLLQSFGFDLCLNWYTLPLYPGEA